MNNTKNIKIVIGISYILIILIFLWFFFQNFSIQAFSNYEIIKNPASRSSKLRIAVKVENETEVKTNLKQKFQYLLDVEKYSREL